jgi:CTP synthase (UTP-ammonia lyase)
LVADTTQTVQIHTKTAQPSLTSRPFAPHPLFASFVAAAAALSRLV